MGSKIRTAVVAGFVLAALPALAQQPGTADSKPRAAQVQPDAAKLPPLPDGTFITVQKPGQMLTKDIIGRKVVGADGKSIGDVDHVVVDETGRVAAVVLGVGGFLGLGAKLIAVPFDKIERSTTTGGATELKFAATAKQLEAAPPFKSLADIKRAEDQRKANEALKVRDPSRPGMPAPPRSQ